MFVEAHGSYTRTILCSIRFRLSLTFSVVIDLKEENSPKSLRYACIFWLVGSETGKSLICIGFEVFTAVTMKNVIFWYVLPCRSCEMNRRFGGKYRLLSLLPAHAGYSVADFYILKMEAIRSSETSVHFTWIYTAPHPRRRRSSL
jgi:hypothetical protein